MPDIFERLGKELKKMPQEVIDLYKSVTKEAVISTGKATANFLKQNSGSQSLNSNMTTEFIDLDDYYAYRISWDEDKIVNVDKGKGVGSYGSKQELKRESGKRNYSLRPATYHDLAYILNFGHTVHFKDGRTGFVDGTHFIDRAYTQVIKGWQKRRDEQFVTEAQKIAKKFE